MDDESGESIDDQVPVIAVRELESWRLLRLTSCERTLSYTEIEGSVSSGLRLYETAVTSETVSQEN